MLQPRNPGLHIGSFIPCGSEGAPSSELKVRKRLVPVTERKATKGTSLLALFCAQGHGALDLKGDSSMCMEVKVAEYMFGLTGHLSVTTAQDNAALGVNRLSLELLCLWGEMHLGPSTGRG